MTLTPPSEDELIALGSRIDSAAADAMSVYEITSGMGVTEEERNSIVMLAAMAFQYGTNRDPRGLSSYFTKKFGYTDESQYPPMLSEVSDDIWDLWGRLASIVIEPLAHARLHDLCFCGRKGNLRDHARDAAAGYLRAAAGLETTADLTQSAVIALRQCEYLRRARALGHLTGHSDFSDNAAKGIVAQSSRWTRQRLSMLEERW